MFLKKVLSGCLQHIFYVLQGTKCAKLVVNTTAKDFCFGSALYPCSHRIMRSNSLYVDYWIADYWKNQHCPYNLLLVVLQLIYMCVVSTPGQLMEN